MSQKYDYDVIIIGAGIGGIISGCYLAKSGFKTLIIEKNHNAGGYCTSFVRKGYKFDSSIHYIGGVKKGSLSRILEELEIKDELRFNQSDPADKIILPDCSTFIRANSQDTIEEFKKSFPRESSNIDNFFKFILQSNFIAICRKTIGVSFKELLDAFFRESKLKSTIGVLLLGNMGLPLSRISALASVVFFREFLLDPGYYPIGGMQHFANCLVSKYNSFGGKIIFSSEVTRVIVNDNVVQGVVTAAGNELKSKIVISDIDATTLFKNMIPVETKESKIVNQLAPSNSVFVAYIGTKNDCGGKLNSCNTWFFTTDDLEDCYSSLRVNLKEMKIPGIMLSFPSEKEHVGGSLKKHTVQIFTMASFENEEFWRKNRFAMSEAMLSLAERIIPGIQGNMDVIIDATPLTFHRYTLNRDGAAFGWESTVEQANASFLPQKTSLKNLFLVGHWCTMGGGQGGVSTVALSGKKASEFVVNILESKN